MRSAGARASYDRSTGRSPRRTALFSRCGISKVRGPMRRSSRYPTVGGAVTRSGYLSPAASSKAVTVWCCTTNGAMVRARGVPLHWPWRRWRTTWKPCSKGPTCATPCLVGHSMGGMTIMSLATHRPHVLKERAKATVLVATTATSVGGWPRSGSQLAGALIASPLVSRSMRARNGHLLVCAVFGESPDRSHMDLTRELFADRDGTVRGDFLLAFGDEPARGDRNHRPTDDRDGGSRDTLTLPAKADQIVSTIPGARLVTLQNRGHMLPLEDPDAVTDEIAAPSRASRLALRRDGAPPAPSSFPRPPPRR